MRKAALDRTQAGGRPPAAATARPTPELLLIASVLIGSIIGPLNGTMIVVALSSIADDFSLSITGASWLLTGFLIGTASLNTLGGKVGDRFGRRPVMLIALAAFGILSLGAALAPNFAALLFFRISQALAVTMIAPNGMALLREVIPASRRAARFGLVAGGMSLSAAAGPAVGGLLLDLADWRALFYVNVPVIVAALILGWIALPKAQPAGPRPRFDIAGAVLLPVVLVIAALVLIAVSEGAALRPVAAGAVAAAVLGALFVLWEMRHQDPIMQPRLFTVRSFNAAIAGQILSFGMMFALLLAVPLMLQARGVYSDLQIGLVLTTMALSMALISPVGGHLADRYGRRAPTVAASAVAAAGLLLLVISGSEAPMILIVATLAVTGIGLGGANPGRNTAVLESVSRDQIGVASGVYSTARNFGGITAAAIIAGLIGTGGVDEASVEMVFMIALAGAVLNTVVSLGLRPRPPADPEVD